MVVSTKSVLIVFFSVRVRRQLKKRSRHVVQAATMIMMSISEPDAFDVQHPWKGFCDDSELINALFSKPRGNFIQFLNK
jgi:hypothetical protein